MFLVIFLLDIEPVDFSHPEEFVAVGEHQVIQFSQGTWKNFSQMVHFNTDRLNIDLKIIREGENVVVQLNCIFTLRLWAQTYLKLIFCSEQAIFWLLELINKFEQRKLAITELQYVMTDLTQFSQLWSELFHI